jgi:hypothetical protein
MSGVEDQSRHAANIAETTLLTPNRLYRPQAVVGWRYPLTDRCQFDMLQIGW